MKNSLLGWIGTAVLLAGAPAAWAGSKMIEIGGDISYWTENRYYSEDVREQGYSFGAHAGVAIPFFHVAADARYARSGSDDIFQVRASGQALLLQVHELFYREDPVSGDQRRALVGLGTTQSAGPLKISASVGGAALLWTRPLEEESKLYAGYAGISVLMHVWKVDGELRAAYVASPSFTPDFKYEGFDSLDALVDHWTTATLASGRVATYFNVAGFELGPELRAEFEKLPDGTEWFATAGVAGRTGLF